MVSFSNSWSARLGGGQSSLVVPGWATFGGWARTKNPIRICKSGSCSLALSSSCSAIRVLTTCLTSESESLDVWSMPSARSSYFRFFKISSVVNQRHLKMAPQNQNSTKKVSDALCKAGKGDVAAIAAMAAMACAHSHLNVSSTPIRKSRLSPQQSPPSHPREDSNKLQNQNQRAKQPLSSPRWETDGPAAPSAKPPITRHELDLEFDSE